MNYQQPYQGYVPSYQDYTPYKYPYQPVTYQPGYQQRNTITGRMVTSVDEIQVSEVPTDGTMALFPSTDGSCVYGKRWNSNGRIDTFRYLPEVTEESTQEEDPVTQLNAKVDRALAMLGHIVGEDAENAE